MQILLTFKCVYLGNSKVVKGPLKVKVGILDTVSFNYFKMYFSHTVF